MEIVGKAPWKVRKIELGPESIGGRRVSSNMGRNLSGNVRSEQTQGVRRRLVFPSLGLERLGRAAQLPLHMGLEVSSGNPRWLCTVVHNHHFICKIKRKLFSAQPQKPLK